MVRVFDWGSKRYYLLGTIHFSKDSVRAARLLVDKVRPTAVVMEVVFPNATADNNSIDSLFEFYYPSYYARQNNIPLIRGTLQFAIFFYQLCISFIQGFLIVAGLLQLI